MKVHNINFRAFYTPEELEEGKQAFKKMLPEDVEIFEEKLEPETEAGVFTQTLFALKAMVLKQGQIKKMLGKINSGLSEEDLTEIKNTLNLRVDDDCNLFLRFDKKAFSEGKFILHSKDSVHVKVKIASFPKKKETALKMAEELFNLK